MINCKLWHFAMYNLLQRKQFKLIYNLFIVHRFELAILNLNLGCYHYYLIISKFKKMDYKKILGQIVIVAAGVAVYNLALKPLLDKAKIG